MLLQVLTPKHVKAMVHMRKVFAQHNIRKWAQKRRKQLVTAVAAPPPARPAEVSYKPSEVSYKPTDVEGVYEYERTG